MVIHLYYIELIKIVILISMFPFCSFSDTVNMQTLNRLYLAYFLYPKL
jgi:hypothetical protein